MTSSPSPIPEVRMNVVDDFCDLPARLTQLLPDRSQSLAVEAPGRSFDSQWAIRPRISIVYRSTIILNASRASSPSRAIATRCINSSLRVLHIARTPQGLIPQTVIPSRVPERTGQG